LTPSGTPSDASEGHSCELCDHYLASTPLGDWLHNDEHWAVGVPPRGEVPGWIMITAKRHAKGVSQLTAEAARALGPLIVTFAGAVETVMQAERTYLVSLLESSPHFHMLIVPRAADAPEELRGFALLQSAPRLLDPPAAEAAARAIRQSVGNAQIN
jgi:diadenosine tetraphosphate (Ap4A) HIT family hydrolase